jgi:hypothetical protein
MVKISLSILPRDDVVFLLPGDLVSRLMFLGVEKGFDLKPDRSPVWPDDSCETESHAGEVMSHASMPNA